MKVPNKALPRFNFEIYPHEAYIDECADGEYVKYDDMLTFIACNAEAAPTLVLRALRELVARRDDRIVEIEAELKKAKESGNVYISKDLLSVTNNDGTVRVRIGALHKNTADADPIGSVPVAKEPVTDEKGFALSLDKAFIRNVTDMALDTITKHLAGVDWSALGGTNAATGDDALRADIEALKESLESNYSLHDVQQAWNKRHNQRLNSIEDAIQSAFEPKSKRRLDVTTQLEAAILRGFRQGLLKELKPGGLLNNV